MRWPRGKYNGQRVSGVQVRFVIDVLWWSLDWPNVLHGTCLSIGPLHVWFGLAYEWRA